MDLWIFRIKICKQVFVFFVNNSLIMCSKIGKQMSEKSEVKSFTVVPATTMDTFH